MTLICPKCRRFTRAALVHVVQMTGTDTAPAEFRRCGECGGLAVVRAQSARGSVVRGRELDEVLEAVGEIDWRERSEPKWYQAALMRGCA